GGMKMYGAKELDIILSHLKKHEIICIADEVLTGFYRTGKMFAGDYLDEKADIICLSKALTGGTMALGVTGCTARIYNSFVSNNKNKTLFHGHSFTANPLACTAALASLELLNKKSCRNKIKVLVARQEKFLKRLRPFLQTVVITNLRCLGTIVAFEVKTTDGDGYLNSIAEIFTPFCMAQGVYLRSLGNTIYVMPPYCTRKKELKKIHNVVIKFLQKHQA
ncbi:MAG: aminotransferase class III-fold pyridoxal phosphate-dependent enzyme, partial [Ginsengibacter sp.]